MCPLASQRRSPSRKRLVIVDYDSAWPGLYERERGVILEAVGDRLVAIEHVGSTSVPGLGAKPIIDLMGGLPGLAEAEACIALLERVGYTFVPRAMRQLPDDRYFERWTDGFERGTEIAHLHLTEYGNTFWREHLLLRDFLRRNPQRARQYELLKRELAPRFTRGGRYSAGKTDFIRSALAEAVRTMAHG